MMNAVFRFLLNLPTKLFYLGFKIKFDLLTLFLFLTVAMIFLLLWAYFRRWHGVLIPAVAALTTGIWGFGFTGWAGITFDPLILVIPTIITQIACGQRQIKLGAVSPTRDFNYVQDTVAGFIAALNSEKGHGEVVNFGSNFEISIGDTAHLIAEAMNAKIEIITDEVRMRPEKSEVERLWADNSKAKQLFGWQPSYGGREGFKRGLIETAEWFAQNDNLRGYKADIYNI